MVDHTREALRQLALVMAVAVPLSVLGFLGSADFFDNYHGVVVTWSAVDGSDGRDDDIAEYLVVRGAGEPLTLILPVRALKDHDLPRSDSGAIPDPIPDGAPTLHKELFSFVFTVEDRPYSTLSPVDLAVPILFLTAVLLGRNLIFAGSPFRLVSDGRIRVFGKRDERGDRVNPPPPPRPKKGPPPGGSKKRRKKKRKR
ncbi:MAG TPA: hypothetical protein QGF58_07375 [Myxococcota bacterium]|nr:hypothetical protein [Myxococcota bacterium]